jgi:hypothetical protein
MKDNLGLMVWNFRSTKLTRILNMVNCGGLTAVEMRGMCKWFTLDYQVQIKKIIPPYWFATSLWNQMNNFAFSPDDRNRYAFPGVSV